MRIGIDLGTSKIVVARLVDDNPRLHLFAGQRYLPCFISKERETWYFGEEARQREEIFPDDTAHSFLLYLADEKHKWQLVGRKYSDADLLTKLIEYAKVDVERKAGEKISDAVVAIPNAFDATQGERLQRVFQNTGISLLRFIPAATASAVYFQHLTKKTNEIVACVNLGAGAFDVGLYRLRSDNAIEVLARGGRFGVGGRWIDEKLEALLLSKAGFKGKLGSEDRAALRQQIGYAKQYLSSMGSYPVKAPKLANPVLSRSEYERLTNEALHDLDATVEDVLRRAGVRPEEIGSVLLLGGLSNVKVVRDYVQEFFHKAPLTHYQDKEPVASGAALEALKKTATDAFGMPLAPSPEPAKTITAPSAVKISSPSLPVVKPPRRKEPIILAFLSLLLVAALGMVFVMERQGAFQTAAITVEMPSDSTHTNASQILQALNEPLPATIAEPGVEMGFQMNGRFGLKTTAGDPDRSDDNEKKLTYNIGGGTSNTRIYVDGKTPIFGSSDGNFTEVPVLTSGQTIEYIDKQVQSDADIVFIIDLSGSMQDEIVSLINSCERFADELAQSAVNYRLGLVTYHDYVTGAHGPQGQLTGDIQVFKQWLAPLPSQLTGGNEVPYQAMSHALTYFKFRQNAKKALVLITDEGSSDSGINLAMMQQQVRAANAIVFPIVESGYQSEYTPLMGPEGKLFAITDNFVSIITDLPKRLASTIKTTIKPLKFVWQYGHVEVQQELSIVPSELSGRQEMMKIAYTLKNNDNAPHEIGLRMMIDTFIGANDGVPFAIPGQGNLIDKSIELQGNDIPNFIQALEQEDLSRPGVMANVIFRGGEATPPDRVVISGWSDPDMPWDYLQTVGGLGAPLLRSGVGNTKDKDSAIGLYYGPWSFYPQTSRTVVAYYGLGSISSTKTQESRLGVIVPTLTLYDRDEFQVVALINQPNANAEVVISLPPQLKLANNNETFRKSVPAPTSQRRQSQVAWFLRIEPNAQGVLPIQVDLSPDGIFETAKVYVRKKITQ